MSNITITNLDPSAIAMGPVDGEEALIAFPGADTYVKGTLLGRKVTSADSYTGVITGTGTHETIMTARAGRSMKATRDPAKAIL